MAAPLHRGDGMKQGTAVATAALALAGAGLLYGCSGSSQPVSGGSATPQLPSQAYCVLKSPLLQTGTSAELTIDGVTYTRTHQPDAPSAIEMPLANPGPQPAGACSGNQQFRFGSGIYDTTGPIGGNPTGHADMFGMVIPPQVPNGTHRFCQTRARGARVCRDTP